VNLKAFILDTLFPIHCISCNKENVWLCDDCFQKIEPVFFQICPVCEKIITEKGQPCERCRKKNRTLDNLIVSARYKENNLSKLVHLYKYNFIEDLHIPLGKLLVKAILKNNLPIPDLIIPIPLHPRRLRWRGFNQSELLAKYVSENLTPGFSIPVFSDLIRRRKYTPPQMKIGKYSERRKNMEEAFEINKQISEKGSADRSPSGGLSASKKRTVRIDTQFQYLQDKKILLIDDIATTGATLFECAKILKQNGAKKVMGAVIARQEFGEK